MSEPTDHTQPDEGLRRAQAEPDQTTRTLLLRIADRLSTERPSLAMREVTRLALALRFATNEYGFDTPDANTAEQLLLRHMPQINRSISRGEYALLLRARVGRHTTQADRVAELHRLAAEDYATGPRLGAARNALAAARTHGNQSGGTQ